MSYAAVCDFSISALHAHSSSLSLNKGLASSTSTLFFFPFSGVAAAGFCGAIVVVKWVMSTSTENGVPVSRDQSWEFKGGKHTKA